MNNFKALSLSVATLITVSGCSTATYVSPETYVSEENIDKFGSPQVSKFHIQPCGLKSPESVVAAVEHFEFDKAEISMAGNKSLDSFIEQIKDKSGQIFIMGHTDEQGSNAYNDRLSKRRATAVQRYIQAKIDVQNYEWEIKSFGEHDPLIARHDQQAFAQNRRVLVVFESKATTSQNPACLPSTQTN